jgi:ribulose-bisphosphate carboxylase small chain
MAALCSVAPVVAKVPAVSTGKASKSSAMQVWNPTNNKCVPVPA